MTNSQPHLKPTTRQLRYLKGLAIRTGGPFAYPQTFAEDRVEAALWNEGVDPIYGYRHCIDITATGGHPLGPRPREAARRRERQQAERRLARIQKRLGKQRAKGAERPMCLFR